MARSYLKVYFDFEERTDELNDGEKGRLLLALLRYAVTGVKPTLTGNERFAFSILKGEIDRDIASYDAKVANGRLGGRPSKEQKTKENQTKPKITKAKPNKTEINLNLKNKNNINEDDINIDVKPPIIPLMFDTFWAAYPKHQDKQGAKKAFEKLNVDQTLLDLMLSAIAAWKRTDQWTKDNGQYIPMPATWLNRRRWEDDIPVAVQAAKGKTVLAQQYEQRDWKESEMAEKLGVDDLFKVGAG